MVNLYAHFEQMFQENLTKIGLRVPGGDHYSYQDILYCTAQMANALHSLGVHAGDRVASIVEKSPHCLFLYLACLQSGIIFLPLNKGYTVDELSYFFADFEPGLIVCDPNLRSVVDAAKLQGCMLHTLDEQGQGSLRVLSDTQNTSFKTVCLEQGALAAVLYTSGTTGKPKGAMITHEGLLNNTRALNEAWAMTAQDMILHALPLFHVHGLFFACHTALLSGAPLLFLPTFEVNAVLEQLPNATVFMGVPTYYTRLLSELRFTKAVTQHTRLFISGSAPLLASTFLEFEARTGHVLLERYGMTETGINTSNPLHGDRKVGTVGLPLPGVNLRIVDDKSQGLCSPEVGHIQVKGSHLFSGYWRNLNKTVEDFTAEGFFKTGDMGYLDEEGYLSIVGRAKDLIITGGLNVYPKEIELTLETMDGVRESAVIGVPHADWGEGIVALIVVEDPQSSALTESHVIDSLRRHHAGYKLPKRVLFVSELPKNTMGKVQKNVLRTQYQDLFSP